MGKKLRISVAVVVCLLIVFIIVGMKGQHYSNSMVDVSWPNCASNDDTKFSMGIIGVTGGLDFTPNPCLTQETTWFSHYSLYMNTGYPGETYGSKFASYPLHCLSANYNCRAYNYGYNASVYAINYSNRQLAYSNVWWLDVETDNSWTPYPSINRSVIEGAIDALKQVPFVTHIGIYSTPYQWNLLTDSWQIGLPAWIATGGESKNVALDYCKTVSFTGGLILLSQYTQKLDINISCN